MQEEEDSVSLFDRQLLKEVDLRKGECKLHNCGLAVNNPGDNLVLRPLCSDDYEKGESALMLFALSVTQSAVCQHLLFLSHQYFI